MDFIELASRTNILKRSVGLTTLNVVIFMSSSEESKNLNCGSRFEPKGSILKTLPRESLLKISDGKII